MAVAWSCNMNNKESVIYVPKDTSDQRIQNLTAIASRVYKTDLNYEGTCQLAKTTSQKMNWQLVQDTSWKGYEEIPAYIMSGYLTQFKELEEIMNQIDSPDITLEEMIDYYKKGVDLIKYSQEKLSKAELTIKKINQDNKK